MKRVIDNMKITLILFTCASVANFYISHGFDVVSLQTGFDNDGVVAAFGDYNGDKLVDVFVINPPGACRTEMCGSCNYGSAFAIAFAIESYVGAGP